MALFTLYILTLLVTKMEMMIYQLLKQWCTFSLRTADRQEMAEHEIVVEQCFDNIFLKDVYHASESMVIDFVSPLLMEGLSSSLNQDANIPVTKMQMVDVMPNLGRKSNLNLNLVENPAIL